MRVLAVACALVCLPATACTPSHGDLDLADAVAVTDHHAAQFGRYETWITRALSVSDPTTSDQGLTETLFAPIRNDSKVCGAWIDLGTRSRRSLSLPADYASPDTRTWTQVRHPSLGWMRVKSNERCPGDAKRRGQKTVAPAATLLARDRDHVGERGPALIMAFVRVDP